MKIFLFFLCVCSLSLSKLNVSGCGHIFYVGRIDTAKHQRPIHRKKHRPDYGCVLTHKYPLARRLKEYPFSKAAKILAVSFQTGMDNRSEMAYDTICYGLHVSNGKLDSLSLIEVRELNSDQIDRLTDIMFNLDTRSRDKLLETVYSCYNPRNALVFFDKSGRVYNYLEVCFECRQIRSPSDKIYFKADCRDLLAIFKQFFVNSGIRYGTLTK